MFFILSKILNYLTQPLVWIVVLMLLSLIIKKAVWKKRLAITGFALLLFFTNEFMSNEFMRAWESPPTPFASIQKKYEYGILLTGVTSSEMPLDDRIYIKRSADRVNHTLKLYNLGIIRKILISGGSGRLIDIGEHEAEKLAELFISMGVPAEDIIIENNSRNTHESAIQVTAMLSQTSPDSLLLITSGYHLPRAAACFKKQGLTIDTFSADIQAHKRRFGFDVLFIPKLEALNHWQTLFKEWFGLTAYWLAGYV